MQYSSAPELLDLVLEQGGRDLRHDFLHTGTRKQGRHWVPGPPAAKPMGLGQPAGVGGADDQTEEVRMSGTTTGIVVFCVVVVLALAIWLGAVALAARRRYSRNPEREPMRGVVQGGQHMGGGRSVMPTRDAPVPPGGGTRPGFKPTSRR
jgi:hypothetical protein